MVFAVACAAPGATARTPSPSPSAATAAPSSSASAVPSGPAATLAPNAVDRFTSDLGYTVDLPLGWRRASCAGGVIQAQPFMATESFTAVPEADEVSTDTGPSAPEILVRVEDAQGATPLGWLQSGRFANGPGLRYEPLTIDGRDGARVSVGVTGETLALAAAARGWIYGIGRAGPAAGGGTAQDGAVIMGSLHVLDVAAVNDPARPTPAPRTAEAVADALATGFSRQDVAALSAVMAPCMGSAAEYAGGTAMSRARYAEQLRQSFLGGLTVSVQARPIDPTARGLAVHSTWSSPGQPDRQVDLMLEADHDRWSWTLALTRRG